MRLPTSYKPALTHRSNTVPPRPRSLLPSMTTRPPPSSGETAAAAADHPANSMPPSIEQPKPRAIISSLLHGASPAGVGRQTFSARSTDDQFAHRREPSPTRSAVSQPPAASTTATTALGGGDSEARVSLWTELKDIQRRARTPVTVAREPLSP